MTNDLFDEVWKRVKACEASAFRTVTGREFQFAIEANGIWVFRNGQVINQRLARTHWNKAIARCPLHQTIDLRDCRGQSYLFGILTDSRIRGGLW